MYKHLCLPFVNGQSDIEKLPKFLAHIGFRPLSTATPDNFPAGALVVLYNSQTFTFDTVLVNGLSNGILFYSHQCGRSSESWCNTFSRDNGYDNYLFKVIS